MFLFLLLASHLDNCLSAQVTLAGETYDTVHFNGLTWMAQNLNYEIADSWCYDNNPANCLKYGRLYTWEAAMRACREVGMRLPTDNEWIELAMSHGGFSNFMYDKDHEDEGDPKKAYEALIEGGNSGFTAQLGGGRLSLGLFNRLGEYGGYWSATELDAGNAWRFDFNRISGRLYRRDLNKPAGLSCRCVKD